MGDARTHSKSSFPDTDASPAGSHAVTKRTQHTHARAGRALGWPPPAREDPALPAGGAQARRAPQPAPILHSRERKA